MSESKEYYSRQLQIGSIHVSEEVVASIVAAAVQEVDGVVGLSASFTTEIQDRLSSKKNLAKGIRILQQDDAVQVDCSVIVLYGHSMQEIGAAVQDAVQQAVESMIGLKVSAVNVNVAGISMTKKD